MKYYINTQNQAEYGVAMPVIVSFSRNIPKGEREKLKNAMNVTASTEVLGAWKWLAPRQLVYRTKEFWPAHTSVTVTSKLNDLTVAGKWSLRGDVERQFKIGDDVRFTIANRTYHGILTRNGVTEKSVPVSMGKEHSKRKFITRSGIKVIMTQERRRILRGPKDDPYEIPTEFAQRMTNTGEFIHSAPWSVRSQGKRNVSHGCTNVSTANAKWLYEAMKIGDPVIVTGTDRRVEKWNGWSGMWAYSWTEWLYGKLPKLEGQPVVHQ